MTQNVLELIRELVEYTIVEGSKHSREADSILNNMREAFKNVDGSTEPNKQEKMIALFMGGTIAALYHDDMKYPHYKQKLYPRDLVQKASDKFPDKKLPISSPLFLEALGKEALLNLPTAFCGELFKIKTNLINTSQPTPFFPKLAEHADKVDQLVKFCIDHKDNLSFSDPDLSAPKDGENVPYDFPANFIQVFVQKHKQSLHSGLFGGFFHRTTLKPYDVLTVQDILDHAQCKTFFGFKNRTRRILEEMEVMNSNGDVIKEEVKSNLFR